VQISLDERAVSDVIAGKARWTFQTVFAICKLLTSLPSLYNGFFREKILKYRLLEKTPHLLRRSGSLVVAFNLRIMPDTL